MRAIAAYFPATLMAYLLASTFSTLMIMAGLMEMAMPVSATDVVAAVWFDWLGLLGSYLPLVAIAFLIALPVAGQLHGRLGFPRRFIYALAGFAADLRQSPRRQSLALWIDALGQFKPEHPVDDVGLDLGIR